MRTAASTFAVICFALAALAIPAKAQEQAPDVQMIPITEAIAIATGRFEGQIVAAELQPGLPTEMTDIVYAFRLLTPLGDILALRVDAANGDILEVDGRGLVDARKPVGAN